ncbi:MAG: aminotransferase class I/II-fold pyridoxal phosphate-dependent enzyme [Deltaproteobacteria bacterium]|jgi:aspartate/methionine/tyrosine aminotransferase|nr:aminotransferase class I/II-fold pyridoxal phosphate-dependent enzyme [Deltaproteobacteria bacterium]
MTNQDRSDASAVLNPLAVALNEKLEVAAPEVLAMLSNMGRRLYFPKGILSQSAEAKQKATRFNATIGIATEGDGPMHLASAAKYLSDIEPAEAFPYAPPAGQPKLREAWRDKQLAENPSLRDKRIGLPVVSSAITHGITLIGNLFVDPGDRIVMPDKLWGNYRLTYEVQCGAKIATFPFFSEGGFNGEGFAQALAENAAGRDKLIVVLNFPNNPTGYMPTLAESEALVAALVAQAKAGTKIVAVFDDAYFGLFYHLGGQSMTESLFSLAANQHPNLLAIKLDGATKELFVWGLRCGFVTIGPGRADTADDVTEVLDAKLRGAIRGGISNIPQLSQTIVRKVLGSPTIGAERKQKLETLKARAAKVHEVANDPRFADSWDVYPFNSGYFMCVDTKGVPAETVRLHLLDEYGIGTIAAGDHDLRIAFSCLAVDDVEPLFEDLHKAVQDMR